MSEPWHIHTLVLDLDDTLYPERDYVVSGFAAVGAWLEEERGVGGFRERAIQLFESGSRGRIFDEALAKLGVEVSPELISELVTVYRRHEPVLKLPAESADLLAWATGRVNLALLTDGYAEVQERKIRALGLDQLIACRVVTDELGREHWKPSPVPYRVVMERFPGPASGYVYVGDNPRKDFTGARQLGWKTVRMRRPHGEHVGYAASANENADAEVGCLSRLREMLLVPEVAR